MKENFKDMAIKTLFILGMLTAACGGATVICVVIAALKLLF